MAEEDEEDNAIVASELDEMSHREIGLIYEDSVRTILFAKSIQWKTVASTLVVFVVIVGLLKYISHAETFVLTLRLAVLFTGLAAVTLVLIFQFWQHTESRKILAIEKLYSSAFREIRNLKSKFEANAHRYIILFFMIGAIVLGGFVAIQSIDNFKPVVSNQFQYKP
tara:strand:+ start:9809 stop:10309 length:501 start_codon:yes stop_codon:yes gene_type:complete